MIVDRYPFPLTEYAAFFRDIAFDIERDPVRIKKHYAHPAMDRVLHVEQDSCETKTQLYEALSYGDAGVLLACPGPSLSGVLFNTIGTPSQKEAFFSHIVQHKSHTFFAVTEPQKGSDAGNMETTLTHGLLNGEKLFIGNGYIGECGIVLARLSPGPLGIRAIYLSPEKIQSTAPLLQRTRLPIVGLMGAQLSYLYFRDLPIEPEDILGQHLSAPARGLLGLVRTFNSMRPCVAALAIGHAQAILDYVFLNRTQLKSTEKFTLDKLSLFLKATRNIVYESAKAVDHNPDESALTSLGKWQATHLCEKIAEASLSFFGKRAFIDHPYLEKWYRDAFAFEYMEGTTYMQQQNVLHGHMQKTFIL